MYVQAESPKAAWASIGSPARPGLGGVEHWAELLKRIFEVDPLQCERRGGPMRIVALVIDPEVIGAILRHLCRAGRDPQGTSERSSVAGRRAPP
jgi:hypothetical protein